MALLVGSVPPDYIRVRVTRVSVRTWVGVLRALESRLVMPRVFLSFVVLLGIQGVEPARAITPGERAAYGTPPSVVGLDDGRLLAPEDLFLSAMAKLDQWTDVRDADEARALLDAVRRLIGELREADSRDPRLFYLTGRLFLAVGQRGDAIDKLRLFVRTRAGRNDWKAHRILGDLLVISYPKLAEASYRNAFELNPTEPTVLYGLSVCAYQLGRLEDASDWARQAVLKDDRQDIGYLSHLARTLARLGQWDGAWREARSALERAIERLEPTSDAYTSVDAQWTLLVDVLRAHVVGQPESIESYERLADAIGRRADNARLLAVFDRIAVLEQGLATQTPPSTRVRLALAELMVEVGRLADARSVVQEVLVDEPDHASARALFLRISEAQAE